MLNNFGIGWRNLFEKRIEFITEFLPEISVSSLERYNGMLRVKFTSTNEHIQYILDCVSYKIERDSVRTCELCGRYGFRRNDEILSESLCLCTTCHVKYVDDILTKQ